MNRWKKDSEDKYSITYQLDYSDGHLVAEFLKDIKKVNVTDIYDDGYEKYERLSVLLSLEEIEWLTAKAKELFKERK